MNVAMLGPQGSGKGTQAEKLVERFGFTRIETGKILREIAASNDPRADLIRETMLKGELVSDEILKRIIQEKLEGVTYSGIIFDGSPRDIQQYSLIREILGEMGQDLDWVISLEIDEAETILRLSNRRTCEKCNRIYNLLTDPPPSPETCECGGKLVQREDDVPEAIVRRLSKYKERTLPVLEKAREAGILIEIDGMRPIMDIHNEIVERLGLNNG